MSARDRPPPLRAAALCGALLAGVTGDPGVESPRFANERVVVVANGASVLSISLARRYAELRRIPVEQLLVLDDVPGGGPASAEPITLEECRDGILRPILAWLDGRGLGDEIDAIVYSSGFPHAVDFSSATRDRSLPSHVGGLAALTGATWFAREVVRDDLSWIALDANRYCKSPPGSGGERGANPLERELWERAQAALRERGWADAEAALRELSTSLPGSGSVWYDLACCEARLGRPDDALRTLARAADAGFWNADHAAQDPDLESLRGDARFARELGRMRARAPRPLPSRGFGADPHGRGRHYLSTFLAWLGPFGTSYAEAVALLERSAAADATKPRGTFYFLKNGDVRATTRLPLFAGAMRELEARGLHAELLEAGRDGQDGILPRNRDDVLGAVVGISDFDWSACGSTLLPGAVAEHLTSCGAMFQAAGQTKLTAFLRAGAAGASGTVTEPYAIQAKFPTPFLHVHYADGGSLAEAFFQSVAGPYQLLVVGDACCRPFASPGRLELAAAATAAPWSGVVELSPAVVAQETERCEAWIDGCPVAVALPGEPLRIDTARLDDGAHQLHVVAIGPPPLAAAFSITRRVWIANREATVRASGPSAPVVLGAPLTLHGRAPAGARVVLYDGSRRLAERVASGGSWRADLPTTALGLGAVELHAHAITASGAVRSDPVVAAVVAANLETRSEPPGDLLPGIALDVGERGRRELRGVVGLSDPLPLAAERVDPAAPTRGTVRGWIRLEADGLHEWSVGRGLLRALAIDGRELLAEAAGDGDRRGGSAAVNLRSGWHRFELELEAVAGGPPRLSILGPNGPATPGDADAGHAGGALRRLPTSRLRPATAAWCDGDRATAAPPGGGTAELEWSDGSARVCAVALFFAGNRGGERELRRGVVVELRDGGGWSALPSEALRVLGPSAPGGSAGRSAVVWSGSARRARRLRVREVEAGTGLLSGLCEIEVWIADGSR